MLKITLICSDINHPVYEELVKWKNNNSERYLINLFTSINEANESGDLLFLVSCSEIVTKDDRSLFNSTLVLHASDLPKNRGWSPHIWAVVNGENKITLTLLEADDKVDTGAIWKKIDINLDGSELFDEINTKLFDAEIYLIHWACENYKNITREKQKEGASNYLRKRTPLDSEIDINKSIQDQFNLLRVCDPDRFPAYFYINGCKYKMKVEKF